ncbi:efflux RND transporter periplasmic adaptor subunit [Streptomyces sp. NPDC055085]
MTVADFLTRPLVRWIALGLAIAVGVVASLLATVDKRARLLYEIKSGDVALTQTLPATLNPSGKYFLFFGRTLSLGEGQPTLANPCDWFPGRSDPANQLGKLTSISAKPGQHVTAGTSLAETDSEQARQSLDASNRSLSDARSALAADQGVAADLAGKLARFDALGQGQSQPSGSSNESLDKFDVNSKILDSLQRVEKAEKQQQAAQKSVDDANIKAPVHGIIDSVNMAVGSTPSCRIPVITMHSDSMSVSATVSSSLLTKLVPGQVAEVKLVETGDTARTSIETVPSEALKKNETVDDSKNSSPHPSSSPNMPRSGTGYPLIVPLEKPPGTFRPGMSAKLNITLAERTSVLFVPSMAIKNKNSQHFVTVVKCHERQGKCRDGKKMSVPVRIGLVGDSRTEILGGLKMNDQVLLPSSAVKDMN